MKKILLKVVLCILTLALVIVSAVSCGPLFPNDEEENKMTKEQAIKIISKVALDYTGIEFDAVDVSNDVSVKKVGLFLDMDQDDFTNLMKSTNLEENEVLKDSKHFFELAASAAYMTLKNAKDFTFAKVYDVNFTNAEGATLETVDCPAVSIVDAEDGGIYILYYTDENLTNERVQITYYLNLHGSVSVLKSMAIYSGETEDGHGRIIADYVQFVAEKTIETASLTLDFDTAEAARNAAKVLSVKSKTMKEIKENTKLITYDYAVHGEDGWTCNGTSLEKKDSWSSFMKDFYKAMTDHIDLYSTDFDSLFADENIIEVEVPETTINPPTDETDPVDPPADETDPVDPPADETDPVDPPADETDPPENTEDESTNIE